MENKILLELCYDDAIDAAISALGAGANPNYEDEEGTTPLHWAVWNGNLQLVSALVACGANVEKCDKYGVTALFLAKNWGYKAIAHMLIQVGTH